VHSPRTGTPPSAPAGNTGKLETKALPLKSHSADGKKQERILTDAEIQKLKGEVDECVVNSKESKKKGSKPNGAKGDHPDVEMALPEPKVPRRGAAARAAAQALLASLATPAPSQAPKAKPGRKGKDPKAKAKAKVKKNPKSRAAKTKKAGFYFAFMTSCP